MGMRIFELNGPVSFTDEEKRMLEDAQNCPIEYDDDLPEFTEEQLRQFHRVSDANKILTM